MRHSRLEFTSRAPAPSDMYRRMSATLAGLLACWPDARHSLTTRSSRAQPNLFHHRILTPEAKAFSYNTLISLTKVIKSLQVYCITVTCNKRTNDVCRIAGKRNECVIYPEYCSPFKCIYVLSKNANGPESLLSFY